MANHNLPTAASLYTEVLTIIDERLDEIARGLDSNPALSPSISPTNLPLHAIRWNSAEKKWQKQTSLGNWVDLTDVFNISISGTSSVGAGAVTVSTSQSITGQKTFTQDVIIQDGTNEKKIFLGSGGYMYGNTGYWGVYVGPAANMYVNYTDGSISSTGNVTAYSDRRLKKDLLKITNALDKVCNLTGYTFTRIDNNLKQTGLIAQDVKAVLPEAVTTSEDGILGISYGQLAGLLVEAIKELKSEVADLKKQLDK
jgi:hypothetical protein